MSELLSERDELIENDYLFTSEEILNEMGFISS